MIVQKRGIALSTVSACAIGISLFTMPGIALAQATDAPGGKESAAPAEEIGEIVVTAQFRSQNLQKIPLAITAVNAAMLEARSQTNVSDVANRAPNVTLTTASGGLGGSQATSITIRGVGQNDFNLAVEPGVGMYVDDVYYGTMYGSMLDLLDLDRVEILRGPQGTLSGKNSEGGAVKLFSKQPSGETEGYAEMGVGSFNHRTLRAGANFAIVPDKLFLRVTGLAEKQDGFVKRYDYQCFTGQPADQLGLIPSLASGGPKGCDLGTEGGKDVLAVRAALRWQIADGIDTTVTVDDTRDRSDPAPSVLTYQGLWHGPGFSLIGAPGPNLASNFVPPKGSYYNFSNYCGLIGTPSQYCTNPVNRLDAWGISNVLNADLGGGFSIKSITAYRKLDQSSVKDNDASPFARAMNGWTVDYEQFTQELRLNGAIGDIANWTIGGFYFRADALQGGRINLDGTTDNIIPFAVPTDFVFNDPVKIRSKSGFAHIEVRPLERLTVTGGIRYTDDYKRFDFVRSLPPGHPAGIVDSSLVATNGGGGTFQASRWDYRAAIAYQATPDVNMYAQFATGFKGGGINPRPYYQLQIRPFDPETVTSYELGFKSQWFDRRLRLNVSAFHNKYDDIQLTLSSCPSLIPTGAPPNCYLPANVGKATINGAEAEVEMRPVDGLLIDSSLSYLDFQYDSVNPATLVTLNDKPPFTPKWKFSIGAQYEVNLGDSGSITPRIDFLTQSTQYSAPRNFPNNRIAPYGIFNGRLTYRSLNSKWQLSLAVTNLFDKYYAVYIDDQSAPNNLQDQWVAMQPGRPREFQLSLKRNF